MQAQCKPEVYKLEAHCGRDPERSRRGEPAAEILSVLSEGTRSCPAPDDRGRVARAFDLAQMATGRKLLKDRIATRPAPSAGSLFVTNATLTTFLECST
jgi:hypothetical protein